MTPAPFSIREARLAEDRDIFVGFVDKLQVFEHAFEPDRRIDPRAGADYLPVLLRHVEENHGRIFVAEQGGKPIGWAVFHCHESKNFVVEDERRCGYVAELFVEEAVRGHGVGRALIAACEDAARALGLKRLMIGVHAGNTRARRTYEAAGFSPYMLELRKYL